MKVYDVFVIGGGHAGIEAACAASKMGCQVGLVTMEKDAMGRLSCNPAIGGTAKGHLVREIDALGGVMGIIADRSGIQFRMLNRSKGPAVWSPRSQNDRKIYSLEALKVIANHPKIEIIQKSIVSIETENNKIIGVKTNEGELIATKSVVLCSGTFLNGLMHTGMSSVSGGRFGEMPATGITESLLKLGFESGRLKTGTPPRLNANSINFSILEEQPGDDDPKPFSFKTDKSSFPFLPQVSCHVTYTDQTVHKILETGFDKSPMFTGRIKGIGPRYCPSIEDKIVRFAEKEKHQLFLEPEGLDTNLIYVNGFSTSLPTEVQLAALKKVRGLEEVEMIRPGYAVEYDFFPPNQVDLTLETKIIDGLYFAGQINGTSGYEEAAAQGLIAGINAASKILGRNEFVLKRSEAYIGVLIDDLVTKSTEEPYRMFTSRAEHRLLLRQDNADRRLTKYGFELGLVEKEMLAELEKREVIISKSIELFNQKKISPKEINPFLEMKGTNGIESPEIISKLSKRPEIKLKELLLLDGFSEDEKIAELLNDEISLEQVEFELKYEGYIKREFETVKKLERYEKTRIPLSLNYSNLKQLSSEGRDKLQRFKPRSIGQASRIAGITPSDISILLVYLKN
ncbi:MAG: tRNA uridine-5-carboxymethylaminomethyl(34) synthesis enzyme MnmG [Chlorobiaceae bacterium]|nr:tRNA uridine-5-carboxymethylaminomethyl(34) synthesis enzyme MnmG [Chlorobiaceae bacterium]